MRLSKYEKETIVLTSEGDDTVQIYTFNASLKRRLAEYEKSIHIWQGWIDGQPKEV